IAIGAGIPAGVVGAGAGIVPNGAFTGQWEFDPAAILGGVGGGLVGGVHGVAGHMRATTLGGKGYTGTNFAESTGKLERKRAFGTDGSSESPKSEILDDEHSSTAGSRPPSVRSASNEMYRPPTRSISHDAPAGSGDQQHAPQANGRSESRASSVPNDDSTRPVPQAR
ncbi:hypothetical protein ACW9HQ_54000, partial [Nocardia gipuzkoensis]